MSDSKPVALPAHLWDALDLMSSEMGVGRDALVSQAVFTLARLNGFVVPGRGLSSAEHSPQGHKSAPVSARPLPRPAPLPKGRPANISQPEPEDEGNPFDNPPPESDYQDDPAQEDLEQPEDELPPEEDPQPAPPVRSVGKPTLTFIMANREPFKMATDIVTIGRGKTCEFVIESNRVSREHARVIREGAAFVLEDNKSSNGTFFGPNKEKVTRRPIRDGDEFTFGTEKIRFQIRK
jgi:hypothetical protein